MRGTEPAFSGQKVPPALSLNVVSPPMLRGSRRAGRFSDESFRLRDVQFDLPQIRVESCLLFEEVPNLLGTRSLSRPDRRPCISSAHEIQRALQASYMTPPARNHQQQASTLRITSTQYGSKIPLDRCLSDNRGRLDRGGNANSPHLL